jgi:hypothetical protein
MIIWDRGSIRSTSAIGVTRGCGSRRGSSGDAIFFFVGGFANLVTFDAYRRRGRPRERSSGTACAAPATVARVPGRVDRAQVTLHLADVGATAGPPLWGETRLLRGMLPPGETIPFGPLWFLAVYIVVVCISPWTIALHRRFGLWVPAAMLLGAVLADGIGFMGGHPVARWANVAFVLLFPHQLGHAYGDGSMLRWPRQAFWGMVVAVSPDSPLTNPPIWTVFGHVRYTWFPGIGAYPKSLLGTSVEVVSNAYPPTLCFLLGGVWSIGAVMLLRPGLTRWLQHRRPWMFTISVNAVIMTIFLWHMTAICWRSCLWPLGFGHETDSTLRWWLERPVWLVVPGLILLGLIAIFGRFERTGAKAAAGA